VELGGRACHYATYNRDSASTQLAVIYKASPFDVMSDDEFDKIPDSFAGIDWDTVPGLSAIPLASQPSLSTSGEGVPPPVEPGLSTPPKGEDSTPGSTHYSYDEWDDTFLTELDKVERNLPPPQPQALGGLLSTADRGEGPSRDPSSAGDALTSRYFHGEDLLCVIVVVHLIHP
jgi:hypothetical protein